MPTRRHTLVLPELGLRSREVLASLWLVELGDALTAGDRLLEILAGSVTIDLPAPASGVLAEMLVSEDEVLTVGQPLAVIESDEDSPPEPLD